MTGHARPSRVADPNLICQECHTMVATDQKHTYLDCLKVKWEHGGLTRPEMESLFRYAVAGEDRL